MPECPNCGEMVEKPYKSWKVNNDRTQVTIEMRLYACSNCGHKFRKGTRVED